MSDADAIVPAAVPPWLLPAQQSLHAQKAADLLPHALLFSGEQGIGEAQLAEALANGLLCSAAGGEACGRCHDCRLIAAGTHPDRIVLGPLEDKKVISVDQVRDLMPLVYTTPQVAQVSLVLIAPADSLNRNAANALLKCLEEPPAHTYFLLITAFPGRLPATVRSRCQLTPLPSPEHSAALDWLVAHGVERDLAGQYLQVFPRRPVAALLQAEAQQQLQHAVTLAMTAALQQTQTVLQAAQALKAYDLTQIAGVYLQLLADVAKACCELPVPRLPPALQQWLARSNVAAADVLAHAASVQESIAATHAGSHFNKELTTEAWLLALQRLGRGASTHN